MHFFESFFLSFIIEMAQKARDLREKLVC